MTLRKRYPSLRDANVTIPDTITQTLVDMINSLEETSFKTRYLKESFLSKFVSPDTDPASVRRQRAINKWLATEKNNSATNDRLLLLHDGFHILPHVSWQKFRAKVCDIVVSIIGEVPPVDALVGAFSGGASTSRGRTTSHPANKYLGQADVTADALPWFALLEDELPGWFQFRDDIRKNIVAGNVLFTVPKKTDIDRCACKEPDINMFMQKGVGNFIRRSLRRVGINLNDQTINRNLAQAGSEFGHLATLDLSSASDSISTELVAQFLPPLWFTLLDDIRSKVTIIDGDEHVNEMFSSMGNGFTFELQSLLFYSIARSVNFFEGIRGVVSVYGDDIIVPVDSYQSLVWVLSVLGFEVNASKSFSEGPFRESCGGHFYHGYDVTPFYLRGPVSRLTDLIHFGNSLRKWGSVDSIQIIDPDIWPIWAFIRDLIPRRFWGGRDLAVKTQLVTPDEGVSKLSPITRRKSLGTGGYVHWLNITWVRSLAPNEAIETSFCVETGTLYRIRSAAKAAVSSSFPMFLQEISVTSE